MTCAARDRLSRLWRGIACDIQGVAVDIGVLLGDGVRARGHVLQSGAASTGDDDRLCEAIGTGDSEGIGLVGRLITADQHVLCNYEVALDFGVGVSQYHRNLLAYLGRRAAVPVDGPGIGSVTGAARPPPSPVKTASISTISCPAITHSSSRAPIGTNHDESVGLMRILIAAYDHFTDFQRTDCLRVGIDDFQIGGTTCLVFNAALPADHQGLVIDVNGFSLLHHVGAGSQVADFSLSGVGDGEGLFVAVWTRDSEGILLSLLPCPSAIDHLLMT